MIIICPHCGALLLEPADKCAFCDASLVDITREPVLMGVAANAADGADDSVDPADPEWRREVSRRLEAYRVRRGRSRPDDDSQSGLPFSRRPRSFRDERDEGLIKGGAQQ